MGPSNNELKYPITAEYGKWKSQKLKISCFDVRFMGAITNKKYLTPNSNWEVLCLFQKLFWIYFNRTYCNRNCDIVDHRICGHIVFPNKIWCKTLWMYWISQFFWCTHLFPTCNFLILINFLNVIWKDGNV